MLSSAFGIPVALQATCATLSPRSVPADFGFLVLLCKIYVILVGVFSVEANKKPACFFSRRVVKTYFYYPVIENLACWSWLSTRFLASGPARAAMHSLCLRKRASQFLRMCVDSSSKTNLLIPRYGKHVNQILPGRKEIRREDIGIRPGG
jgi:hypothetical protein